MAYTKTNWANSPATTSPLNSNNLNKIEDGLFNQDARITTAETDIDNLQTSWLPAGETWTYSSVDNPTSVITISGDKTGKYSLGMKIKFTNNSNIIYGIITKISYTSPNTTLTFLHEINPSTSQALHIMTNSAITENYYSIVKNPYGFPNDTAKWTIKSTISANQIQSSPATNTWYNLGSLSLSIPIGLWNLGYDALLYSDRSASGDISYFSTLSTSSSAVSDSEFNVGSESNPILTLSTVHKKDKIVNLASKTIYYLLEKTMVLSGISRLLLYGDQQTIIIKAVCAYL